MYPLYQDASKVLELMEQRKGTANRLSLNSSIRNKKACLAIAAETSRLVLVSMCAAMFIWCRPVCSSGANQSSAGKLADILGFFFKSIMHARERVCVCVWVIYLLL